MKNSIVLLLFILIIGGCAKKSVPIQPKRKTTHQEAERAIKEAQEEVEMTKGAIESEKDNIEPGIDIARREAELEQAKDLLEAGRYKEAEEVARKAQEEASRAKNKLLAMVREKDDSEVRSTPDQPGYEEEDYSLQGEAVTYTVGTWEYDRDCLWNIADKMLGDPWKWKRIYQANKNQIKDPNMIYEGQIFIIPVQ